MRLVFAKTRFPSSGFHIAELRQPRTSWAGRLFYFSLEFFFECVEDTAMRFDDAKLNNTITYYGEQSPSKRFSSISDISPRTLTGLGALFFKCL